MKLSNTAAFLFIVPIFIAFPNNVHGFHVAPSPDIVRILSQQHHAFTTFTTTLPHVPDLFALYQNALHTLPLQTQMITGASLAIAGDISAQKLDKSRQFEPKRTLSFAAFDACYRAVQHIIYPPMKDYFHGQFLIHAISALSPTTFSHENIDYVHNQLLAAAAEQSLVSQLVVIPLIYYPIFFAVTGMVQGLNWNQTLERGMQSFIPLMQRNLLFWIPVQFAVFGWIQDDAMQISILIACGLVWTMILSAFAGSASTDEPINEFDEQLQVQMNVERETSTIVPFSSTPREMAYATFSSANSTGIVEEQLR